MLVAKTDFLPLCTLVVKRYLPSAHARRVGESWIIIWQDVTIKMQVFFVVLMAKFVANLSDKQLTQTTAKVMLL